jgi:hypothetical protein
MRKPPKQLVSAVYRGDFHDYRTVPVRILDFSLGYDFQTNTGRLDVRYGIKDNAPDGTFNDLRERFHEALKPCDLRSLGCGTYGNAYTYSAEIPAKHGKCDGDVRARDILRTVLNGLGITEFPATFRMNISREYEVRVPKNTPGTFRWIPEGQLLEEDIAAYLGGK